MHYDTKRIIVHNDQSSLKVCHGNYSSIRHTFRIWLKITSFPVTRILTNSVKPFYSAVTYSSPSFRYCVKSKVQIINKLTQTHTNSHNYYLTKSKTLLQLRLYTGLIWPFKCYTVQISLIFARKSSHQLETTKTKMNIIMKSPNSWKSKYSTLHGSVNFTGVNVVKIHDVCKAAIILVLERTDIQR